MPYPSPLIFMSMYVSSGNISIDIARFSNTFSFHTFECLSISPMVKLHKYHFCKTMCIKAILALTVRKNVQRKKYVLVLMLMWSSIVDCRTVMIALSRVWAGEEQYDFTLSEGAIKRNQTCQSITSLLRLQRIRPFMSHIYNIKARQCP
jgi:hypothetical protein